MPSQLNKLLPTKPPPSIRITGLNQSSTMLPSIPVIDLEYELPDGNYSKGIRDIIYVIYWFGLINILQSLWFYLIRKAYTSSPQSHNFPVANTTNPNVTSPIIRKKAPKFPQNPAFNADRLADQSFLLIYYLISVSCGLWIWSSQPYWPFQAEGFFEDYPPTSLPGYFKAYYLIQIGFWFQQLVQLTILTKKADRRKDHWAMVTHHLITSTLLLTSYALHYTRVGNAVLVVMDIADVFLCLAKCLKYLKYNLLCDITFVAFVLVWMISRHGLYFWLVWSIWGPGFKAIDPDYYRFFDKNTSSQVFGRFKGFTLTSAGWFGITYSATGSSSKIISYLTPYTLSCYITLFAMLQILLLYWLMLIFKVIIKVIRGGGGADDVREDSDDEDHHEHDE